MYTHAACLLSLSLSLSLYPYLPSHTGFSDVDNNVNIAAITLGAMIATVSIIFTLVLAAVIISSVIKYVQLIEAHVCPACHVSYQFLESGNNQKL